MMAVIHVAYTLDIGNERIQSKGKKVHTSSYWNVVIGGSIGNSVAH